ncbi:hypothetical protein FHT36_003274 [Xanthobacter sp. SG618]|uniref:hypothetical protein n=1 Tax=Xanthobacter sp. SG618 TaxID=2587121 RepID=UPI00145E83EB|nr:hypothetical protein [Xanthobacter sp. SG618]NMN59364.1 hypothetical protein [Xanthobacter sp. SG618]
MEVSEFLKRDRTTKQPAPPQRGRSNALVVRTHLRPVDVYAYLRARFGEPNAFQNILRRDDSDNWIHWDFNIKSDGVDIYIAGTSREIHFMVGEALTDREWKALILGFRSEFARLGREKSEMTRTFEKFFVFQNKYVALANICAELHEILVDMPPFEPIRPRKASLKNPNYLAAPLRRAGERASTLYGACVQLSLLTPVLAEAYINMFALILRHPNLRHDWNAYHAFVREHIPNRIGRLHEVCFGMGPVDRQTEAYGRFMSVMNKRNFNIHGNVDPEREAIETIYFEGRRPLYSESGHHIGRFFADLENLHRPDVVIYDYEAVHAFLHELTTYLTPSVAFFLSNVIDDPYPGFETRQKRVTRILPNQLMMGVFGQLRYDDDLRVSW